MTHPGVKVAGLSETDGLIDIQSIRHVYPGSPRAALDGIDLTIGKGLFGLLGPNGAGKSTLMRILCTLLVPTGGTVRIQGLDVVKDRRAVRQLFGYLPQEFGAWRQHRVEEVLDTLAQLSGIADRGRRRQRIQQVLAELGLEAVARRKVKTLSGGMVRRLGVAQALIHEPRVLVVDEPTVGMDPEERIRFRQLLAQLAAERTILLSTHVVADLGSACHDLALLDAGRMIFRGSPDELLREAAGKVFEVTVATVDEERNLGTEFEIVSRASEGSTMRLRGVTAGRVPAGGVVVASPTLEEAYLTRMAMHRAARGPGRAGQEPAGREPAGREPQS